MPVDAVYEGLRRVQDRLMARLPKLSAEDLALKATADSWPVWAIVAHMAVTRVYWLCVVCGEPGMEGTPFDDPAQDGWEDHLDTPRASRS